MQINKTISILFASAALLAPASANAISLHSYSSFEGSSETSIQTDKWMMKKNQSVQQNLAYAYTGVASWYGPGFYGNRTANGEIYRP